MALRCLFVDMNSYFASVEQQYRPELRGRPMAVAPLRAETTSCIAASYEAKRFGVKTGTRVSDARRMCPGIVFVEARPELYVRVHHRILSAVETCTPIEAVLSIDELCCRLTRHEQQLEGAYDLAQRIKQSIRERVGQQLKCSIGVAPNRLLAKVASDMHKPDGLTVIEAEELPGRLYSLELRDFSGIGPRMEQRFFRAGIRTVEQLCSLSAAELGRIWGSRMIGGNWWRLLRGEDVPVKSTHRRSIGHSRVLAPELRNPADAWTMLKRLLAKAARRLRSMGYWTNQMHVSVRYLEAPAWKASHRFPATQDTLSLLRELLELPIPRSRQTILKVGVVLDHLIPGACQTHSLFEEDQRLGELSRAMDRIQQRFGQAAIDFEALRGRGGPIPMRIAFTRIPELELYDRDENLDELD